MLEIIKNISETAKKFKDFFASRFFQPKGIDLVIDEGHKKIIEKRLNGEGFDQEAFDFLCSYKQMIQQNQRCQRIIEIAAPMVKETAKPQEVEEDWFDFFFDKARLTSDEKIQNMWANILAEEVNNPNKFSRSLIHTLSIMSNKQVALFCNISRFSMYEFQNDDVSPFVFVSTNIEAYADSRISRSELLELQQLGLIHCDFKDEWVFSDRKKFRYGNNVIIIYGDPNNGNKIKVGNIVFTENGKTLFDIVGDNYKSYRTDILNFTIERLKARNCRILINDKEV